jgi:hypothetical protein
MNLRLWTLLLGLILSPTLANAAPVPKGARTLGLSVGPAQDGDYGRAFAVAQVVGIQSVTLSLDWPRLETAPGRYDNTLLTLADGFYPTRHMAVDLILRPINTNRLEVPDDLRDKPFDDPAVIARFERLLDDVFAHLPTLTLKSLGIGNEVDDYFGQDTGRWQQYQTFYRAVRAYAHVKRPGLKVGVVATFDGLTGPSQKPLQALNASSDLILTTYYPLNPDFTVRPLTTIAPDLARLCALYPKRSVALLEAGCPSSPDCASSPALQAEFVRRLLAAWDAHAAQIVSVTFSWQTDISPEGTAGFGKYYGVSAKPFAAFLGSLGLRTYAGKDKPAWNALKEEAKVRGWGGRD